MVRRRERSGKALKAHRRGSCHGRPCFAAVLKNSLDGLNGDMARRWQKTAAAGQRVRGDLGTQWQSAKGPRKGFVSWFRAWDGSGKALKVLAGQSRICAVIPGAAPPTPRLSRGRRIRTSSHGCGSRFMFAKYSILWPDWRWSYFSPRGVFLSASRKQTTQKESGFHGARLTPYQKRTLLVSASSAFNLHKCRWTIWDNFIKSDEPPCRFCELSIWAHNLHQRILGAEWRRSLGCCADSCPQNHALPPKAELIWAPSTYILKGANSMQTAKVVSPLPLAFELAPLRGMSNGLMSIRRSSSQAAKMGFKETDNTRSFHVPFQVFTGLLDFHASQCIYSKKCKVWSCHSLILAGPLGFQIRRNSKFRGGWSIPRHP